MEDKIVITQNNYKVYLRPWISYPKFIEIQKGFTANITIDPKDEKQEIKPFSANLSFEVEEKLMRYLIIKIEDKDGNIVDLKDDYLPLPPDDCMEVKAVIDIISEEAASSYSKKKLTPSQAQPSESTTTK